MPFHRGEDGVGRRMGVLDGDGDCRRGGQFWGESGASHCNQWGRRRALPKLLWGARPVD